VATIKPRYCGPDLKRKRSYHNHRIDGNECILASNTAWCRTCRAFLTRFTCVIIEQRSVVQNLISIQGEKVVIYGPLDELEAKEKYATKCKL